jgi:hypothetical protein
MKKLRNGFVSIVLSGCLGLLLTSAFVVSNPVTAYAWVCCTAHCSGGPPRNCHYSATCCGAYCFADDNVGCSSYYADGEQLNCKQCDYSEGCVPFYCN